MKTVSLATLLAAASMAPAAWGLPYATLNLGNGNLTVHNPTGQRYDIINFKSPVGSSGPYKAPSYPNGPIPGARVDLGDLPNFLVFLEVPPGAFPLGAGTVDVAPGQIPAVSLDVYRRWPEDSPGRRSFIATEPVPAGVLTSRLVYEPATGNLKLLSDFGSGDDPYWDIQIQSDGGHLTGAPQPLPGASLDSSQSPSRLSYFSVPRGQYDLGNVVRPGTKITDIHLASFAYYSDVLLASEVPTARWNPATGDVSVHNLLAAASAELRLNGQTLWTSSGQAGRSTSAPSCRSARRPAV